MDLGGAAGRDDGELDAELAAAPGEQPLAGAVEREREPALSIVRGMIPSLLNRRAIASIAALAIAAPAVAIAESGPKAGSAYSGSIGPGYPIHFKVSRSGKTIDDLSVHFEATCLPGAGDVAPAFPFTTLAIKHGAFVGDSSITTAGSSMSIRLEGSFKSAEATGKVIGRESIKSLGSCEQTEPFTAHVK